METKEKKKEMKKNSTPKPETVLCRRIEQSMNMLECFICGAFGYEDDFRPPTSEDMVCFDCCDSE